MSFIMLVFLGKKNVRIDTSLFATPAATLLYPQAASNPWNHDEHLESVDKVEFHTGRPTKWTWNLQKKPARLKEPWLTDADCDSILTPFWNHKKPHTRRAAFQVNRARKFAWCGSIGVTMAVKAIVAGVFFFFFPMDLQLCEF